jgi:acyl-homoserine lactone acylase PvdQ
MLLTFFAGLVGVVAPVSNDTVTLRWDDYGVPHVSAETEHGAYYGAGYACARLRLFQMYFQRLSYKGQLAEYFGFGTVNRVHEYLEHDIRMRTFGLDDFAVQTVANLRSNPDPERRVVAELLQAYADGVNQYVADTQHLGGLFDEYGIDPRSTPWEPEDSIGLLLRFGVMRGQGERWKEEPSSLNVLRGAQAADPNPPSSGGAWTGTQWDGFMASVIGKTVCDDSSGSVQGPLPANPSQEASGRRSFLAVSDVVLERLQGYASGTGPFANSYGEPLTPYWGAGQQHASCFTEAPPCSEAWAFHGNVMENGEAIVVAEPRLPIFVPSIFVEWYMECPDFRVRGAGLPGTPFIFVGATDYNAWGVSSLEVDQVDLYKITRHSDDEEYWLDGAWVPLLDREERIWISGESDPVRLPITDTVFGPIVNHLLPEQTLGTYARRAIPLHDITADGATAFVDMFRANTVRKFRTALAKWTTPPANVVYGGRSGRVGYQAVGFLPVRRPRQVVSLESCAPEQENCFDCSTDCEVEIGPLAGWVAQDGTRSENAWGPSEILHGDLMPHVEPRTGFSFTANNLPAGSWYPIPNRPGVAGHTMRSRRLVERLDKLWQDHLDFGLPITARDVVAPRTDTRLSTLVDLVTLARWIVDCHENDPDCPLTINLLGNQRIALAELEGWLDEGGTMAHAPFRPAHRALLLAYTLPLNFRETELTEVYGGGHSGLELYLKDAICRIAPGEAGLTDLEADWIRLRFRKAWNILLTLESTIAPFDSCRFGPGDTDLSAEDPTTWLPYLEEHLLARQFPHWVDLEMNGPYCEATDYVPLSLDPNKPPAVTETTLVNAFEHVLWGQPGQLYSQVTRFTEEGPVVISMLMPEQAEPGHPDLAFRTQVDLWEQARHKSGPMSMFFECTDGDCEQTTLSYQAP